MKVPSTDDRVPLMQADQLPLDTPCLVLDELRRLYPVRGLVHVGAGDSLHELFYADWGLSSVLLLEADEDRCATLAISVQGRSGWTVVNALVDQQPGPVEFLLASNPRASGVVDPERFQFVWRNLRTVERRPMTATPLQALMAAPTVSDNPGPAYNWLLVDCLPARPVLDGVGVWNGAFDVVVARALLLPDGEAVAGAGHDEIETSMRARGYRRMGVLKAGHPAIGQLVYVKDWKAALSLHMHESDERIALLDAECKRALAARTDLQSEVAQLRLSADSCALLHAAALAGLREELQAARAGLAEHSEDHAQRQQLIDQQQAQINQLQAQVDRHKLREAQSQLQVDTLQAELGSRDSAIADQLRSMAEQASALANQTQRLDEQAHALTLAEAKLVNLEQELGERDQLRTDLALAKALAAQGDASVVEGQARMLELQAMLEQCQAQRDAQLEKTREQADELVEQKRQTTYWQQSQAPAKALADGQAQQLAALLPRIDEQERFLSDRQQQIDRLTRDHDEHARVSSERLYHIEGLMKTQAEQTQRLQEQAQRMEVLERERGELDNRQRLLDQEIVKAQAQLELIKDVVLREKAF